MADVRVKLVVTGESTEAIDFSISPCPDKVSDEIQQGLGNSRIDDAKSIGQVQDALLHILKTLKDNHPNKDKKTAHILLTANGETLLDKDMEL